MRLFTFLLLGLSASVLPSFAQEPFKAPTRIVQSIDLLGAQTDGTPTVNLFGIPYYRQLFGSDSIRATIGTHRLILANGQQLEQLAEALTESDLFVEVTSGPHTGKLSLIEEVDLTTNSIKVAKRVQALSEGTTLRFGRCHSLYSLFGEDNRYGLRPGHSLEDADNLLLFDPATQSLKQYYLSLSQLGWVEAGNETELTPDIPLLPHQGLLLRRRDAEPIRMWFKGKPSDLVLSTPIYPGLNLLANQLVEQGEELKSVRQALLGESTPRQSTRLKNFNPEQAEKAASHAAESLDGESTVKQNWYTRLGLTKDDQLYVVGDTVLIFTMKETKAAWHAQLNF